MELLFMYSAGDCSRRQLLNVGICRDSTHYIPFHAPTAAASVAHADHAHHSSSGGASVLGVVSGGQYRRRHLDYLAERPFVNDQDAFLAELARQQAADSDPTSQTVADALGWDVFDRTSQLLDRLENRGLVKTTMPPARSGDTHLDHWVTLTAEGRVHAQASRVEANATQALGSGERWTRIDRPVLLELAQASESDEGVVRVDDIAARHDLRYRDVLKSVDTLKRTGFVDTQLDPDSGGEYSFIRLTQKGLEATELWPTPATALDRMISALEAMAENSDDEDTRTRARKILDGFAGAGRQVAIGVATAVATGQIPQ